MYTGCELLIINYLESGEAFTLFAEIVIFLYFDVRDVDLKGVSKVTLGCCQGNRDGTEENI